MKLEELTSMKPFKVENNTPPFELEIQTLLIFNSEKMIEPLPREKFSSKDEF